MGKYNGKTFLEDISNRLKDLRGDKANTTYLVSEIDWSPDCGYPKVRSYAYSKGSDNLMKEIEKDDNRELINVQAFEIPHYVKNQVGDHWVQNYIHENRLKPTNSYYANGRLGVLFNDDVPAWANKLVDSEIKFFSEKEVMLLEMIIDGSTTDSKAKYVELNKGEGDFEIKEQQIDFLKRTNLDAFIEENPLFSNKELSFKMSQEGLYLASAYLEKSRLLSALFPDINEYKEYIQSNGLEKIILDSLGKIDSTTAAEIKNHFYGYRPQSALDDWYDKGLTDQEMRLKKESFKEINPAHEKIKSKIKLGILDKLKEVLIDKPEVFEKISTSLLKRGVASTRQEQKVTEAFVVPDTIKGVQLSVEQRERLSQGKGVFVKGMKSDRDGKLFSGVAKINKETGEVAFTPPMHKKKEVQGEKAQQRDERKPNQSKPTIVVAKPVAKAKARRM